MQDKAARAGGGEPRAPRGGRGRSTLATLTLMRRMAVTISTRLFGRGTSRLPMYCRERKEISRVPTALETLRSHHGLSGIHRGNAGSLLGNEQHFSMLHLNPCTPPTMKLFPHHNISSSQKPFF